jgi:hypothetical protein
LIKIFDFFQIIYFPKRAILLYPNLEAGATGLDWVTSKYLVDLRT